MSPATPAPDKDAALNSAKISATSLKSTTPVDTRTLAHRLRLGWASLLVEGCSTVGIRVKEVASAFMVTPDAGNPLRVVFALASKSNVFPGNTQHSGSSTSLANAPSVKPAFSRAPFNAELCPIMVCVYSRAIMSPSDARRGLLGIVCFLGTHFAASIHERTSFSSFTASFARSSGLIVRKKSLKSKTPLSSLAACLAGASS
mmetsp:Transcript_39949/g.76418  ORF Transcript_39949/g.76418 Transcript_39949/m.76418 type:complete len:202 (+) Transcript_39949:1275-1880(+)